VMNLHFSRGVVLAIAFTILSIGSTVYIFTSASNYLAFYPALNRIQIRITSVALTNTSESQKIVSARISVNNPTDYQGFSVPAAMLFMYFYNNTSSIFRWPLLVGTETQGVSLGPHTQAFPQIVVVLDPENSSSMQSFIVESSSPVYANVTLSVQIGTFLSPVIGSVNLYDAEAVPLSTS